MVMASGRAAKYFVDAASGRDSNSGSSADAPWQSVRRVNQARLGPGDTVRFKAGCVWRESLDCRSGIEGRPVTHSSYGEGPKPALQASLDLGSLDAWIAAGSNVWKTCEDSIIDRQPLPSFAPGDWGIYCDGNGLATMAANTDDRNDKVYTLHCLHAGERPTNIQLNYCGIDLQPEKVIRYRFRAKATKPFTVSEIVLMRAQRPWGSYGVLLKPTVQIATDWQDYEVLFRTTIDTPVSDGRLSFFVGKAIANDKDIRYENNTLNHARDALIWFFNPRLGEIDINHNTYVQDCEDPDEARLFRWTEVAKEGVTFKEYRNATGNDQDSSLKAR
jgi:hypothetical protein